MVPRIRQVQIQNYKSIERAVVDLEPFTAFVGPNGAGKSNFVDALAFVQECLSLGLEGASKAHGGSLFFPRWTLGKEVHVGFRFLLDLAGGSKADYAFEISGRGYDRFRVGREQCTIRAPGQPDWMFAIAEGEFLHPIPGIRPKMEPDRLALFAASATEELRPVYDFLSAMRIYSIEPFRMAGSNESGSAEILKSHGSNAAAVLRSIEEKSPETAERISELLTRAVQGVEGVRTRTRDRQVSLEFLKDLGNEDPTTFYTIDMSDGTLRILGLLLALYQSWRPSLVAIEEPEATVHPAAAELVVQVLLDAAQDRQVLVTTHSPDILDAKELSDDQIRVVTMEQSRTIIAPLTKASRKAIRERLYTPGELLRIDELNQDFEAARETARNLDLFGGTPTVAYS
jgi:predicted ATPase